MPEQEELEAHYAKSSISNGFHIDLIVSETENSGRLLADSCNAEWSSELVFPDSTRSDNCCCTRSQLHGVLDKIRCKSDTIVAHTAGSFGLDVFPENIIEKALFYPLQTFTKDREINFDKLPVFIESAEEKSGLILADWQNQSEQWYILLILSIEECFIWLPYLHAILQIICSQKGKRSASKAGFPFEVLESIN